MVVTRKSERKKAPTATATATATPIRNPYTKTYPKKAPPKKNASPILNPYKKKAPKKRVPRKKKASPKKKKATRKRQAATATTRLPIPAADDGLDVAASAAAAADDDAAASITDPDIAPTVLDAAADDASFVPPFLARTLPAVPPLPSSTTTSEQEFTAIPSIAGDFTLNNILQSLRSNPYALGNDTALLKELSFNSTPHERRMEKMEAQFFSALASHPQAKPLADLVYDPENPFEDTYRLYVLVRAPIAPNKLKILNWSLLIFSMRYVKEKYRDLDLANDPALFADAQYEPGVVDTNLKCLFSKFRKNGIVYTQGRDFNQPGTSH